MWTWKVTRFCASGVKDIALWVSFCSESLRELAASWMSLFHWFFPWSSLIPLATTWAVVWLPSWWMAPSAMAGGTESRRSGKHLPHGRQSQATRGWMCVQLPFGPTVLSPTFTWQPHVAIVSHPCPLLTPMGRNLNPCICSEWKEMAQRKHSTNCIVYIHLT